MNKNRDQYDKPGMVRSYRGAALLLATLLASLTLTVTFIVGTVALVAKYPEFTARAVFGTGLVSIVYLIFREYWRGSVPSKMWGLTLLCLSVALALVQIIGIGQ